MAVDTLPNTNDTAMTTAELLAFTQRELDAEAARQAQVAAESNGDLFQSSQTGATLDFSKKNLREIPVEVIALFKDKVERLALSHNPQIIIPKEIVQCDRLRYLNLRANKLVEFPKYVLLLSQLEILDLSKNDITTIPEGIKAMTSLKFLAIMRNKITRLPLALGEMSNLHKLKFEDNPIEFPSLEELQLPANLNANGMQEMDRDREICLQVKRVLKSKALRQRILKPATEDEIADSNETPKPLRRTATGRFPVKPSMSKIDISEITRSASNSPPDAQLTTKPSYVGTPTKSGAPAPIVAPSYSSMSNRTRSESGSTSASIRSRRQGFVPVKRSNDLGSVSEVANSVRSSNASTIKGMHAYKLSTSSVMSGIGSSSGAETSSSPVSPVDGAGSEHRLLPNSRKHIDPSQHPTKVQRSLAVRAARRLHLSLCQLHRPLHQIAVGIVQALPKKSNLKRHLFHAIAMTEHLDRSLALLDGRTITSTEESELKRRIMSLVHSALKSSSIAMDSMQSCLQRTGPILNGVHARCLMHQLYATTIEARNVLQLLDIPVSYTSGEPKETPRASRMPTQNSRIVTPTDVKPVINNKRLRGATILRNEVSVDALRVIPPAKSVENSRSNTMTSSFGSAMSSSTEAFPMQSAALPSRHNAMRNLLNHSSDEHDDNTEQFEAIFLKLREACEAATRTLPSCHHELNLQIDHAARDGNRSAGRLWQIAAKSYHKVSRAHQDLGDRLSAVQLKDPGVRTQKDFWQLCDTFVQSWTEFAMSVKKLSQEGYDITAVRSLMKPMQRIVKDLSKTISDSPLYHQAVRGTNTDLRTLAPPFPLSLNTASAQAVAHMASNPSSAAPSSTMTVSVPATPLTAALGPAAQATLVSTPNSAAPTNDYFTVIGKQPNPTRGLHEPFAPVNVSTAPQVALPALPNNGQSTMNYGRR